MTRDGVGVGAFEVVFSTDCIGWSSLDPHDEPDAVRLALAAAARVVTILSPSESFENCSADMKADPNGLQHKDKDKIKSQTG